MYLNSRKKKILKELVYTLDYLHHIDVDDFEEYEQNSQKLQEYLNNVLQWIDKW